MTTIWTNNKSKAIEAYSDPECNVCGAVIHNSFEQNDDREAIENAIYQHYTNNHSDESNLSQLIEQQIYDQFAKTKRTLYHKSQFTKRGEMLVDIARGGNSDGMKIAGVADLLEEIDPDVIGNTPDANRLAKAIEDTTINPEETAVDRAGQLMRDQKATSNFWEDSQKSKVPQGQGHKWQRHGEADFPANRYGEIKNEDDIQQLFEDWKEHVIDVNDKFSWIDFADGDGYTEEQAEKLWNNVQKFGFGEGRWSGATDDELQDALTMPSTLDYKRRIDDRPKDSHITVDLSDKKSHDQLDDEFWKGIRESKASEVKEEFSEDAYLSLINDSYEVPMEFHGRFYNSAEEWKDHDPIAFREDYLNWIDGNEKDGIDTGHDDYHNQSSSDDQFKGQSTEDFDSYNLGNPKDDLEKPTSADQRIADTQESGQVDTDPHWKSGRFRRGGSWADKKEEWQKSQGEAKEVIDDTEKDEIFQYLFELQSSGKTNMFGSIPWVQGEFPHLDVKEVKAVVMEWMQNYQEIHDRMGIDFI